MRQLRCFWRRLAGVLAGQREDRELAEELESHLAMATEENLRRGMPPDEARRAAVLKFGGLEAVKDSYRDQRGLPAIDMLLQDARYALRGMRRSPAFTLIAVLSLAAGIAAATAVFSIVNATLLRPLAYREPDRLVTISMSNPSIGLPYDELSVSIPIFDSFRTEARSLEEAALFHDYSYNLAGEGEPERIPAARVSASLFDILGVAPELGRTFTAEEDRLGREDLVLISDRLWRRRFGADPRVLGKKVILDGSPHTIIGVMPPGFRFPEGGELPPSVGTVPPAELWRPLAAADWERSCLGCLNFSMLARLRPGVTPEQAQAELTAMVVRATRGNKDSGDGWGATVRTLKDKVTYRARPALLILFGAVTALLLIVCVNVASLLIARGLQRRGEIALRLSLGAARGRLVRQLFTEALILALCSAALAVPMAAGGVRVLLAVAPEGIPRIESAGLDWRVLLFALAATFLASLLFGIVPALDAVRHGLAEIVRARGSGANKPSRLRPALIVTEFALSVVLLVFAALLAQSFVGVAHTPMGFHPENVLTMRLPLATSNSDDGRRAAELEQLARNCGELPGIVSAAVVSGLPLTGDREGRTTRAEETPNTPADQQPLLRYIAITPDYFRTLGIRLLDGRGFQAVEPAQVAIVSASAAQRIWPGVVNPVGRRVTDGGLPMTVVGIVEDTRASGLDQDVKPYLYLPFRQFVPDEVALAVRSTGDPTHLAAAIKAEVWKLDKTQPVTKVALMRQVVADSVAPRRFQAALMGVFAVFALILAAGGIYGVISYWVAQRTHEIGIRMALGATRFGVLADVFRQAASLALVGGAIGLGAAFALTPLVRSLLYGVGTGEPLVYAASAAVLLAVAVTASLGPARRAARLDPMTCLRCE